MSNGNADSIVRYFRNRLPVMLDGAVQRKDDRGALLRRARASLGKGRSGPLPAEILRETLDAVADADAAPTKTMAGAAPVGPHHARVWWDRRVLDNLDDVLARLDDPRLVLRFYDVTGLDPDAGRWHAAFDLDVELRESGKTVHFWSADRSYAVDLGYVHADGRFLRLARTNVVDLPRDCAGTAGAGETARSRIRPAGDRGAAYVAPDAAAREWAGGRADSADRDWNAELVVHMLYRAFLLEGPRALRRVPALTRRDAGVLRGEYVARRRGQAGTAVSAPGAAAFLVRRLDVAAASSAASAESAGKLPAVAVAPAPAAESVDFVRLQGLLRAARSGAVREETAGGGAILLPAAVSVPPRIHIRVADAEVPAALFAVSVFEAAKKLRQSLAELRALDSSGAAAVARGSRMSSAPEGRARRIRGPLHA